MLWVTKYKINIKSTWRRTGDLLGKQVILMENLKPKSMQSLTPFINDSVAGCSEGMQGKSLCEGSQDMSIRIRESVRFIWSWPFQEMCWFSHSPFSQSSFYRIPPSVPVLPTFPWLIALPAPPKLYNPSLAVFGWTGGLVCCWFVSWRPSCSINCTDH